MGKAEGNGDEAKDFIKGDVLIKIWIEFLMR